MFKNSGSMDYFQKNKKTVLGLISAVLLSGTAVIGDFFPYQEVDEVNKMPSENKISSEEKLRLPPHSVSQQEKLSRAKPKTMALTASYNGFNYLGTLDGYTVEYRTITTISGVIYQFLGTSGATQLGFGCFCAVVNGTKTWQGMSSSSCGPANPNVAIALNSQIMGSYSINVGMPGGACCKSVPKVGTTEIPGILSFCGG